MEGDNGERSGAQSRVSSAASSHVNEEDVEDEVKASPTSLVSRKIYLQIVLSKQAMACTEQVLFFFLFV